jgi:hypothetical protein
MNQLRLDDVWHSSAAYLVLTDANCYALAPFKATHFDAVKGGKS